jgi:hypothetical protein
LAVADSAAAAAEAAAAPTWLLPAVADWVRRLLD